MKITETVMKNLSLGLIKDIQQKSLNLKELYEKLLGDSANANFKNEQSIDSIKESIEDLASFVDNSAYAIEFASSHDSAPLGVLEKMQIENYEQLVEKLKTEEGRGDIFASSGDYKKAQPQEKTPPPSFEQMEELYEKQQKHTGPLMSDVIVQSSLKYDEPGTIENLLLNENVYPPNILKIMIMITKAELAVKKKDTLLLQSFFLEYKLSAEEVVKTKELLLRHGSKQ